MTEFTSKEAELIKTVVGALSIQADQPGFLDTAIVVDSVLKKCDAVIQSEEEIPNN